MYVCKQKCICVNKEVCICMYECMYVCLYVCMSVYIYICMYVNKYVWMYIWMYVCDALTCCLLIFSSGDFAYPFLIYLCKQVWMYSIYVSVSMYIWCANLPLNVFESGRVPVPGSNLCSCVCMYVTIYVCMQVCSYALKYVLTSYIYLTQHYIHTNISKHNVYGYISLKS